MKIAVFVTLIAVASAGQTFLGELAAGGFNGGGFAGAPGFAGGVGFAGGLGGGAINTGTSQSQRSEDGIGNYQYSYGIQSNTGSNSAQESGDVYGRKRGSYSLGVIDGRQRVLDYVADEGGFRAAIRTNEPGTAPLSPADVSLDAPDTSGIARATIQAASGTLNALAAAPAPAVGGFGVGGFGLGVGGLRAGFGGIGGIAAPAFASSGFIGGGHGGLGGGVLNAGFANGGYGGFGNGGGVLNSGFVGGGYGGGVLNGGGYGGFAARRVAITAPAFAAPQPIIQEPINHIPRPSAYSTQIAHVAPQAIAAPQIVAPQIAAPQVIAPAFAPQSFVQQPVAYQQPIVQQAIAVPRPTSYSVGVSHVAPAGGVGLPAYKQAALGGFGGFGGVGGYARGLGGFNGGYSGGFNGNYAGGVKGGW